MRPISIALLAVGFGLLKVSKSVELQGDLAIVPGDRLSYHLLALVILLAAAACVINVGWSALRAIRGRKPARITELAKVFVDEEPFDPDAALARHYERRREQPVTDEAPLRPRNPGFGRKGL